MHIITGSYMSSAMVRILIIFYFIAVVNAVDLDYCFDTAVSFRNCCMYGYNKTDEKIRIECAQELGEAYLCDYSMCYGEKKGYIMPNKTINRIVLDELLLEEYENNTKIFDVVNEKCLSGDINSYIQDDYCNLREIAHCVHFYTMTKCDKWIHNDECEDIKNTIQECVKIAP